MLLDWMKALLANFQQDDDKTQIYFTLINVGTSWVKISIP